MIWLGYIAGIFTTLCYIPQIMRVFKTKSAHDISLIFNAMLLTGTFLWLSYGICSHDIPIIIWNSIGAVLVSTLLYAKLRYGR